VVASLWRALHSRRRFFLIAGPCVIESEVLCLEVARYLKRTCARWKVPFVFKASYDKANRTSAKAFRGPGLEEGLAILGRVRKRLGVPVITDVHSPAEATAAGRVVDVLQIPAFLCRQTDLIRAAVATGKVVNLKKGQFLAPEDMGQVVGKAEAAGGRRLLLTERGASFGYHNLVADMRSIPIMRAWGYPVVFDATHAVQLPGGGVDRSAGQREFAPVLARAAVAAGADGVFLETHPDPDRGLSDGPNMVSLDAVPKVLRSLCRVYRAVRTVVALGVLIVGAVSVRAQISDAPVRGFTFPILDRETLQLQARVRGDVAQAVSADRVQIQAARMESYGEDGQTNLLVLTERCVLLTEERRLESSESLQVSSGDGRLELTGRGFSWDEVQGLVISNDVMSRLRRLPVPAPADAAVSESPEAPREPMAIQSDRLTYREGRITFVGRVAVNEGADHLGCDTLLFQLHVSPGELAPGQTGEDYREQVESVEAVGNVEVTSSNLVARAERGVYAMASQQLSLIGRPRWESGDREGEAGQVLLDRREERLRAWDGVRMSLPAEVMGVVPPMDRAVQEDESNAPDRVEVHSDTLDVWPDPQVDGMNRALFQKAVRLSQGSGVLECERLDVRYASVPEGVAPSEDGAPGEAGGWVLIGASAEDGVRFQQSTNELSGARAVYSADSGVMEVTGPVTWELAGGQGRSDRLRLSVVGRTTEATGQVRMTMPPGSFEALSLVGAGESSIPMVESEEGNAGVEGSRSPVEVACETFVFREAGQGREFGMADFLGGVEVTSEPRMRMACERLLAELEPATNSLHRLVATGNVVMETQETQGQRIARGDRAEYLATEDRLWLTGDDGVEMDLVDAEGTHLGRGGLAVYEVGQEILELRNGAVLESLYGRLSGDRVRVDREERVLAAGGRWKMVIPLRQEAQEALGAIEEGGAK